MKQKSVLKTKIIQHTCKDGEISITKCIPSVLAHLKTVLLTQQTACHSTKVYWYAQHLQSTLVSIHTIKTMRNTPSPAYLNRFHELFGNHRTKRSLTSNQHHRFFGLANKLHNLIHLKIEATRPRDNRAASAAATAPHKRTDFFHSRHRNLCW